MRKLVVLILVIIIVISLAFSFLIFNKGTRQEPKISYDNNNSIKTGDKIPIEKPLDKVTKGEPLAVSSKLQRFYGQYNGSYYFKEDYKFIRLDRNGNVKRVYNIADYFPGYNRSFGFIVDDRNIYTVAAKVINNEDNEYFDDPKANIKVAVFNIKTGKLTGKYKLPKRIGEFIISKKAPDGDLIGLGLFSIRKFSLKSGKIVEAYRANNIVTKKGNLTYTLARGGVGVDKKGNYYLGFTTFNKYERAGTTVRIINKKGQIFKEFFVKVNFKKEHMVLIGLDKQENILVSTEGRPTGEVVLAYNKGGKLVKTYDLPNIKQNLSNPIRYSDFREIDGQIYQQVRENSQYKHYRMYSSQEGK